MEDQNNHVAKVGATPYDDYKPGLKDPDGRLIKTVVGRHRRFIVYTTSDHFVGWVYDELPERLRPAIAEFQLLTGLARSTLASRYRSRVAIHLASALYGALLTDEKADPLSSFTAARTFIETKNRERARLHYVAISTVFAAVVFCVLYLAPFIPTSSLILATIVKGVAGGTIGAMASLIQRARDINVDPFASPFDLALQGMLRVILGGVFGGFVVMASLSNLAFGNFNSDPIGLLVLTVVAGFSERLVPDFIERTAGSLGEEKNEANPKP